jgi:hypothetical protein
MMKTNPLFVDSTRIHGDRIGTQVELTNIILFDDERISITVMGQRGEPIHTQLEPIDEKTFGARVWLRHLEKISYQFVIENGDRRVFHSAIIQGHAEHMIVEEWTPSIEEVPALIEMKREEQTIPRTWVAEAAKTAESLIEKFDL